MVNSLSLCSVLLTEQDTLLIEIFLPPTLSWYHPTSWSFAWTILLLQCQTFKYWSFHGLAFTLFFLFLFIQTVCSQFIQYYGFKYHCFSTYQFFFFTPDLSMRLSIYVLSSQHSHVNLLSFLNIVCPNKNSWFFAWFYISHH